MDNNQIFLVVAKANESLLALINKKEVLIGTFSTFVTFLASFAF